MADQMSTIVSFYAGADSYAEAAARLRADCDALGLRHDIRELAASPDEDWAMLCRRKIPFFAELLADHPEGILWIDVDARILRRPDAILGGEYDIGGFLRNRTSLQNFDRAIVTRTLMPTCIQFTGSAKARAFVQLAAGLECGATVTATDDYFLEEAFRRFPGTLGIHAFDPALCAVKADLVQAETCFLFGASGNVPQFKGKVVQHQAQAFTSARVRKTLFDLALAALRREDFAAAAVLAGEAHRAEPDDAAVALKAAKIQFKARAWDAAHMTLAAIPQSPDRQPEFAEQVQELSARIATKRAGRHS